jgi:hypothetical protein
MRDDKDTPIYSRLIDDPAAEHAIDAFVIGLAEQVDALQDCEARNALADLLALVDRLARDAECTGFDALVRAAHGIREACRADAAEEARKALVELTELARRIRLGHRGAA